MTSIDKLQIRGIRSFSPNSAQTLEFQKPLTLCAHPLPAPCLGAVAHPLTTCKPGRIVGKNGSGKTVRGRTRTLTLPSHTLRHRSLTQP